MFLIKNLKQQLISLSVPPLCGGGASPPPPPPAGLCPHIQLSGMVTASSSSRIQLGCQKHTPATCPASISG